MAGSPNFREMIGKVEGILASPGTRDEKLMAICTLLEKAVEHYNWVVFYLVDGTKREMVLGPYVGEPTEHLRISFGEGVCGQAAEKGESLMVQDVSKETNYLSCSPTVRSEIVVPIFKKEQFVGELDIDSNIVSAFDREDKIFLERVCGLVSGSF